MKTWMSGSVLVGAVLVLFGSACGGDPTSSDGAGVTYCPLRVGEAGGQALSVCPDEEPPPPRCTSFSYSEWSHCTGTGVQTRTVIARYPFGCTGTPRTSQACTSYDVGVLSGSTTCAGGSGAIQIFMDNQDNDRWGMPSSSYTSGWTGATSTDVRGNTRFYFCRVDGTALKPLSPVPDMTKDYMVLKLGTICPTGSVEFSRFFDNEDDDTWDSNTSSYAGDIAPNFLDGNGNFMIRFCLFRSGLDYLQPDPVTGNLFPQFGISYGVFAPDDFYFAISNQRGLIHTDDEDSSPADRFDFLASYSPPLDLTEVWRIIDGYPHWGSTTTLMHTALVSQPMP